MLKDTLNKGISTPIAMGIVLILVIILGSFTWWQYEEIRKEETELPEIELPEKEGITDWEVFTNKKIGYEIRYPKEWKRKTTGWEYIFFEGNTFEIFFGEYPMQPLDACVVPACSYEVPMKIAGIEANKTISAIWGWIDYDEEGYGRVVYDNGEISCHEVRDEECMPCEKERKMSKEECEGLPYRIKITSHFLSEDGLFVFSFLCPDWQGSEGINSCNQLYDQILSTFRFIEEDETAECSSDSDCNASYWCWKGVCGPPIPGETDNCEKNICIKECNTDNDCQSGKECKLINLFEGGDVSVGLRKGCVGSDFYYAID